MLKLKEDAVLAAEVVKVSRHCRGPRLYSSQVQEDAIAAFTAAQNANDWKTAKALLDPVAPQSWVLLTPEEDWNGLFNALMALTTARKGCGYDFNQIILDGPVDGKPHAYKCPQCGVEGTYLPPALSPEVTE